MEEDNGLKPQPPRFFRERNHPFITEGQLDVGTEECLQYELIENEGDGRGYWERRQRGDWEDMPNLWGPWEE